MSPESAQSRRPRSDGQQNRAALLSAARSLFDAEGPRASLNEVARRAGVANATLYRHFPTRAELLGAVYGHEVEELDRLSARLLAESSSIDRAISTWLEAFVEHVATKRDLAHAIPDKSDGKRGEQFDGWHHSMRLALARLIRSGKADGVVRRDMNAAELLTLASAIGMTAVDQRKRRALLRLVRDGYRAG